MESSRESSLRREKPEGNVPVAVDPASNSSSEDIAAKYDQAEANYQPKSFKFWTILLGLYLAVFIVALVSPSLFHSQSFIDNLRTEQS